MTTTTIDLNDPGPDLANQRADEVESAAMVPIEVAKGGRVRVGTASWTDPTMTAAGVFYPAAATTAEERLQYYASTFPLVEVDATYYALPSARTAELWVERTPADFTFDIKAHALMTGQGTETKRLPRPSARRCRRPPPPRAGSTPRTSRRRSWTRSGRRSAMAWSRSARRASSARSCSSSRAGSSRPRRTERRSRTP